MSTTSPVQTLPEAAADYLSAVAAELTDLPEGEREDLLEEVGGHLADVSEEIGSELHAASLRLRLGPPEVYAAELRSAAGYDSPPAVSVNVATRLRTRAVEFGHWLDHKPGADAIRRLAVELRPGWWVARVWVGLTWMSLDRGLTVVPRVTHNSFANFVVLGAALALSVWLGRRATEPHLARTWRAGLVVANLLLVAGCVPVMAAINERSAWWESGSTVGPANSAPPFVVDPVGGAVTNLFAFGPDGTPIPNFYLYDQDGQPVDIGQNSECVDPESVFPFDNRYPREHYRQQVDSYGNLIDNCVPTGRTPTFGVTIPKASSSPVATASPTPSAG